MDLETTMFFENPGVVAKRRVKHACEKGYGACRAAHIQDVRELFTRMDISLGEEEKSEIPTDVRIANMAKGEEDLALCALMYQYGRYLLIASSREDSPLPTHMGGIWNDNIYNNIDCTQDMHIDMNLQMQYWASAVCSLPECYQPFFRYMENVLVPSGTKTAKITYDADGWTAHVVSNPWGFTSLGWAYNWGAWCAVMIWDYYEYTLDRKFLEERGFPILFTGEPIPRGWKKLLSGPVKHLRCDYNQGTTWNLRKGGTGVRGRKGLYPFGKSPGSVRKAAAVSDWEKWADTGMVL